MWNLSTSQLYFVFCFFRNIIGRRIYITFFLFSIVALLEGIGFIAFIPLISSDLNFNFQLSFFNNFGVDKKTALILILLAFVIKGIVAFFALRRLALFQGEVILNLKIKMFSTAMQESYLSFSKKDSGHYINLINDQSLRALSVFHHLNQAGISIVQGAILIVIGFFSSWKYAVFLIISCLVVIYLFNFLNAYVSKISHRYSVYSGRVSQKCIEYLSYWKYFVSSGRSDMAILDYEKKCDTLIGDYVKMATAGHLTASIREPIAIIIISTLILFELNTPGGSVASILVTLALFYRAMNNFLAFQQSRQGIYDNIGAVKMLNEEFYAEKNDLNLINDKIFNDSVPNITFENVSFYFDERNVLFNDLKFDIKSQSFTSIIGPSGSGKSTIASMLTGLLQPTSGKIIIDGEDLNKFDILKWQKKIGYLTQDQVIIEGTILDNICMPDLSYGKIDKTRAFAAADQAVMLEFIESLPDKFNTLVGDKGFNLSGGQKQRLAIAREIYRDINILILDEPSSALDMKAEALLCESLLNMRNKVTIICITHSQKILEISDHIIRLEPSIEFDGKIAEALATGVSK